MTAVRNLSPGIRGSTILTASGRTFDLMAPKAEMIATIDIAIGLANTCRFGGQLKILRTGHPLFYSVAQHSVLVSRLVPPSLALMGLMHDSAEAYIGDIVGPLKQYLPQFKVIEHRIERVIAKKYGLRFPWSPEIKKADLRALRYEHEQLMHPTGRALPKLADMEPVDGPLIPLESDEAAKQWALRFLELQGAQA